MLSKLAIGALIITNGLLPFKYDFVKAPVYFQPEGFIMSAIDDSSTEATIEKPVVEEPATIEISLPANENNGFKTYMDYRAITDSSSEQWELQQEAYTDEYGMRKVGDYYCVALGSAFATKIGTKFIVTLEDGQELKVILGDQKADQHTDETNKYIQLSEDRINIVEFIVDSSKLEYMSKIMGDISYISHGNFDGKIISIEREDE